MSQKYERLVKAFRRVGRFVSEGYPGLARIRLNTACPGIIHDRRCASGARQFMHTSHIPHAICASPDAGNLGAPYLIGLFLHEFGHLGSRGGEIEADRWAFERFGIPIQYKGRLCLEWVDPKVIRRLGI